MELDWHRLLDILFPPSPDERTLREFTGATFVSKYAPQHLNGITALSSFADPQVRAAIHLAKFHRNRRAMRLLASLLSHHIAALPPLPYTLMPVALSPSRLHARGYNQVAEVLAYAALPERVRTDAHSLSKADRPPQTDLSREGRLANQRGAFSLPDVRACKDRHVLLIDDVVTTGATLRAAAEAVALGEPLSLTLLALAH
jgi:predicted amidophosphoribosyltransferase